MPESQRMNLRESMKNRQMFALLLFLAMGAFGYLLPAVGYFTSVPGDLGDARFNSVILEHLYRWVGGRDHSLWSPEFFYPFQGTLAFSDNHFGTGMVYMLFRWLGFTREGAYNGWFLVGALLNYLVTYFVLRRLNFSDLAAAAGAFVFAFALPAELHQNGHAQLIYRYAIPLAALGFFHALETGRAYYFWQVFLWVAVEFFCSIYLGIFLVYLLAASVLGASFFKWGRGRLLHICSSIPGETPLRKLIFYGVALLSLVAVGLLLFQYHKVSREYGFVRTPGEISELLPRLGSYLVADRSMFSWVGKRFAHVPARWEQQMFVGAGIMLFAIFGAIATIASKRNETVGRVALMSFLILFIVTLHVGGHSIYLLLIKIPGLSAVRVVSRIILVMLFPISILVAVGIDRVRNFGILQNRNAMIAFSVGLVVLLGAETASYEADNELIAVWRGRVISMRTLLPARHVDRPILYISRSHAEPFYSSELDAMILGQEIGMPTLNGYSGNTPPGYEFEQEPCTPYINRLFGYADFHNLPKESIKDFARRVIHLSPEPCRGEVIAGSDHVIGKAQAELIQVTVAGVDYPGRHFWVTISNNSTTILNPLSIKGDIRLSWRFIPLNANGVAMADPGWDARKNLLFVIRPEASTTEMIEADFPNPPGRYRLEVTLVQDGVSWFHDMGMPVGTKVVTTL